MTDKPTFPPEFWRLLAKENPLGSPFIVEQDARDWFELEWPQIREYYRQTSRAKRPNWSLRIVRCWANFTPAKLSTARAFGVASRRSQTGLRLEALAEKALSGEVRAPEGPSALPPMRIGGK